MRKTGTIYFYGALVREGELPLGGGQVGNAKTMKLYRRLGWHVRAIPKYFTPKNRWLLPVIVLLNYMKFVGVLLVGRRKRSLVHIAGFYGLVVYHEWLLVGTSKLLGYTTIYEMRGGGANGYYEQYSAVYRAVFRQTIRWADYIFTQGKENIPLINSCGNTPVYYHPNYIEVEHMAYVQSKVLHNTIHLVYFGRLFAEKRIDLIVETTYSLKEWGYPVTLDLIGEFESKVFEQEIRELIEELSLEELVVIRPKCVQDELWGILQKMHFFLFPSETPKEGQSNALTEAMAWGVVPVAANVGFTKSLVGRNELVLDVYTPQLAAKIVGEIVEQNKWSEYAQYVSQRIDAEFSEEVQLKRLEECIYRMIQTKI